MHKSKIPFIWFELKPLLAFKNDITFHNAVVSYIQMCGESKNDNPKNVSGRPWPLWPPKRKMPLNFSCILLICCRHKGNKYFSNVFALTYSPGYSYHCIIKENTDKNLDIWKINRNPEQDQFFFKNVVKNLSRFGWFIFLTKAINYSKNAFYRLS